MQVTALPSHPQRTHRPHFASTHAHISALEKFLLLEVLLKIFPIKLNYGVAIVSGI